MKKIKKLWMIPLLAGCLAVILYVGWGKKPVELLNDNPPLIDLDAAIKEADFGKNGNTDQNAGDPSEETPGGNNGNTPDDGEDTGVIHEIFVRDERITYEKIPYGSLDTLKRKLMLVYRKGDQILLKDDYAESHVYQRVIEVLEELRQERGFIVSWD